MPKVPILVGAALAALIAAPASAQIDPVVVAQGQVLGAMNQGYADRAAGRVATERPRVRLTSRNRAYCHAKGALRARHGADDPRVVRLYRACAMAGM